MKMFPSSSTGPRSVSFGQTCLWVTLCRSACALGVMALALLMLAGFAAESSAQAPYRVAKAYEDTVRVVVLWNDPVGLCGSDIWVGKQTRDFVLQSLDLTRVLNVKVLPTVLYYDSLSGTPSDEASNIRQAATVADIQNLWPGKLPHVIVHVNAGWGTHNGPNLGAILNWAVQNYVGVVEIGDDAAWLAQTVFGFTLVNNMPQPMGGATWLNQAGDSLWMKIDRSRDHLVDSTVYPFATGIVNHAGGMVPGQRLFFKPYGNSIDGNHRCEADPDAYTVQPSGANKVVFLGYQQAFNAGAVNGEPSGQFGAVDEYNNIAAFQDTIISNNREVVRRAVSLALEPQYIAGQYSLASQQIVYDAIMFASLAHKQQPPDKIVLLVGSDTITAGTFTNVQAQVFVNDTVDHRLSAQTTWNIDQPSRAVGDSITGSSGDTIQFTGTRAYRYARVVGTYRDPTFDIYLRDTAEIYILPAAPYRVTVETDSVADKWNERALTLVQLQPQENTSRIMYAFIRDRYGNLIVANTGRATTAQWQIDPVADMTFASVTIVSGQNWKGQASRVGGLSGSTRILVRQSSLLEDTVSLQIRSVTITKIRLVDATTGTVITSISMTNDDSIRVKVQGLPSNAPTEADQYWENVTATLTLEGGLTSATTTSASSPWTYSPTNTGTGSLRASGASVSNGIPDAVVPVTIRAATRTLTVHADSLYAGLPATLTATVTDSLGRSRPELAQQVVWSQDPTVETGDQYITNQGNQATFTATMAHRYVTLRATLTDPETLVPYTVTVNVWVHPGLPAQIVAESSPTTDLWKPNNLDQVIIPQAINYSQNIYAYVRDQYGNLIDANGGHATQAVWFVSPVEARTYIGHRDSSGQQWISRATRVGPDTSTSGWVAVTQSGIDDTDFVLVTLSNVPIVKIRVVDGAGRVVTNISMTTDDEIPLFVQGLPANAPDSSDQYWQRATGVFSLSAPLQSLTPPSGETYSWTYQPTNAGTGTIVVDYPLVPSVTDYTITVTITTAAPSRIEYTLIDKTPRAGDRIRTEVRIYNRDGLVAGTYCYGATGSAGTGMVKYFDIVGKGTTTLNPTAYTDVPDNMVIGVRPAYTDSVQQCFVGGIDTLETVLYNAATNPHRLLVLLTGKNGVQLKDSTETFTLSPGALDTLKLEYADGTKVPANVDLTAPTGQLSIRAVGYDQYGNRIGPIEATTWDTTGTLHPINPGPVSYQYYTTGGVTTYEDGCIIATADGKSDRVCITVRPPAAQYTSVITRDTTGDGRLDRIEIHLNKLVSVKQLTDSIPLSDVTVTFRTRTASYTFPVTDILARTPGAIKDSVFYIQLDETTTSLPQYSQPQTAWTPTITIDGMDDITSNPKEALDGAGPVIWKVTKVVNDISNHSTDEVTVVFSEDLQDPPAAGDVPSNVFQVWRKTQIDGRDTFVLADSVLDGITTFGNIKGQNTVFFTMTNGKNLTTSDYLKIETGGALPVVADDPTRPADPNNSNAPNANNQRVRVDVEGVKWTVKAGPNPFPVAPQRPTGKETELTYHTKAEIIGETYDRPGWALKYGGSAIQVDLLLPSDTSMEVRNSFKLGVKLAVYDNVGNLVYNRSNDDLLKDNTAAQADFSTGWGTGWAKQLYFYWDGYNDKDMAARPGAYRGLVALTISYTQNGNLKSSTRQSFVNFGVRR